MTFQGTKGLTRFPGAKGPKNRTARILLVLDVVLFPAEAAFEYGTGSAEVVEPRKVSATIFLSHKRTVDIGLKVDTFHVEGACCESFGECRVWEPTWLKDNPDIVQSASATSLLAPAKGAGPTRRRGGPPKWTFSANWTCPFGIPECLIVTDSVVVKRRKMRTPAMTG